MGKKEQAPAQQVTVRLYILLTTEGALKNKQKNEESYLSKCFDRDQISEMRIQCSDI